MLTKTKLSVGKVETDDYKENEEEQGDEYCYSSTVATSAQDSL